MSHVEVAPGCCVICIPCAGIMECVNRTVESAFASVGFKTVGVAKRLEPAEIECLLGCRREIGYAERYVQLSGGISMVMVVCPPKESDESINAAIGQVMATIQKKHRGIGSNPMFPCFIPARDRWSRFMGMFGLDPLVLTETRAA